MAFIDIFALIVILLIIVTVIIVFVIFATAPGNVAEKRNHPQAEAIKMGGWISLICGGFLWPIVMIWAFTNPSSSAASPSGSAPSDDAPDLEARCNALEKKLASVEKQLKTAQGDK